MLSTPVWLVVVVGLAAQVVVMPGADDGPLRDAARQAGVAVVDDAVVRENLALLADVGCAAGETRCLARLAMVSDARAALAALPVTTPPERRDAVVVTAAGERRRIQSTVGALESDIGYALAAPAGARLRLHVDDADAGGEVSFLIDDIVVDAADAVVVRPGEHRIVARWGHRVARAMVMVGAGESVWLTFAAHDLAPESAAIVSPSTASRAVPVGAIVGVGVGVVGTAAAAGMLALAGTAVATAEASDVQTTRAAQATAANQWGAGAGVALAVAVMGAGLTVWSLAHGP